jgi:uncharacterized protein (TIGR00299 family) protein
VTAPFSEKICYLDCFSGVSGDMLLGALIHCGVEPEYLTTELEKLGLDGLHITFSAVKTHAITARKVDIHSSSQQQLRTLPVITELLKNSGLEKDILHRAIAVFTRLARAEAKVHGTSMDKVHFHEVGAVDTIVDIVGTLLCVKQLGIARIFCSALPAPRGFVKCDHGLLPLPAPAVCELLHGVPGYGVDLEQELVTPTGAALVSSLADGFGSQPPMITEITGYGSGSRSLANGQPNLLRCTIGRSEKVVESQTVLIMETNLDDWSGEGFGYLSEQLFTAGAVDVSLCPILMKKGRPGYTLQVISPPAFSQKLQQIIFSETSAIGLRYRRENRSTLARRQIMVSTPWGEIKAKEVKSHQGLTIYPEYEQCRKVAASHKVPLQEVYQAVRSYNKG